MANTKEIEALAAQIGENIYIDVAKWHLYLAEAHLHTVVAERIYPLIEDDRVSEDAVVTLLNNIKVPLGGGKMEVPLGQLLPTKCQLDLMDLLEEFQKKSLIIIKDLVAIILRLMGKQSSYIEQSAVIPYQIRDGEIEILLITTRKKKRWIIPKGIVEPNMTPHASAAQEAFEEAGIIGEVFPEVMGSYTYEKFGGTCRVKVFLLRVDLLQPCWLEDQERDRQWFSLSQAIEQVQEN